jgi:hypothetical protein
MPNTFAYLKMKTNNEGYTTPSIHQPFAHYKYMYRLLSKSTRLIYFI